MKQAPVPPIETDLPTETPTSTQPPATAPIPTPIPTPVPTAITRREAGLVQATLRRLGWDESALEYQDAKGVWTDQNIDYDQNRLAVYRLLVRVRYGDTRGFPNAVQSVDPAKVKTILGDTALPALQKVSRIFTLCSGLQWGQYFDDLTEANTNTFLAGLLAG